MSTDTPEDTPEDSSGDASKDEKTPAKKPAAKRTTRKKASPPAPVDEPVAEESTDADAETADDANGKTDANMNWDKAKETLAEVDWDSRLYHLKRLVMMLAAAIVIWFSSWLFVAIAGAHWLYVFITLDRIEALTTMMGRLGAYIHQLWDYIGYHSDEAVWPFAPFPEAAERQQADDGD